MHDSHIDVNNFNLLHRETTPTMRHTNACMLLWVTNFAVYCWSKTDKKKISTIYAHNICCTTIHTIIRIVVYSIFQSKIDLGDVIVSALYKRCRFHACPIDYIIWHWYGRGWHSRSILTIPFTLLPYSFPNNYSISSEYLINSYYKKSLVCEL